jgi:hypothetical protein
MRDPKGKAIPFRGAVGVAYVRGQKTEDVPQTVVATRRPAKIAIMMRHRGNEVATDVPLTPRAIGELGLIAMSRDLSIAELVGQALPVAIRKGMIEEILSDDVSSSSA